MDSDSKVNMEFSRLETISTVLLLERLVTHIEGSQRLSVLIKLVIVEYGELL